MFTLYSRPLNKGLNCMGPLICGLFSINILEKFFGDLWQFEKTCRQLRSLETLKKLIKMNIQIYYKKLKFIKTYAHTDCTWCHLKQKEM